MSVVISRESIEEAFMRFLGEILAHNEVCGARIKGVDITRDTMEEVGKKAFDDSFHDKYSDVDIFVKVCLPKDGAVTPEEYLKRIDRYGVNSETALGWMFVPANQVYRIVFYNGMRYDLEFEFEYADDVDLDWKEGLNQIEENKEWPVDNINRFWFVQVQALGKLYRKDYLISAHLANMNCNDTLVMQMIMRDQKYGTNHHRYGFSEELEYVNNLGKVPYKKDDPVFNIIADHIYSAALAYDRLVKNFYPQYKDRSNAFFEIWNAYE